MDIRMRSLFLGLLLASLPAIHMGSPPAMGQTTAGQGTLQGQVITLPDGQAAVGVRVRIEPARAPHMRVEEVGPLPVELVTDQEGRFLRMLAPGFYDVSVEAFGFRPGNQRSVSIREGRTTEIIIGLEALPFELDEIVVTPSTFGMLRPQAPSGQLLTRQELEARPHFGNDIFRAVEGVPGVSTTDYTAKPSVRGSRAEEVLTVLDGLELSEPYHLKQWDGSLSIIDLNMIREVSLTTGGFSSEYGDKSGGVLLLESADPGLEGPRTTVGLDFLSSVLKSEGSFDEGRGAWIASARRGFLGLVFKITGRTDEEDLRPSYYDLFSKVQYELRPGHRVSAQVLHAGDDNYGEEGDSTIYRIHYGNSYGWVNWYADLSDRLSTRTVFSLGRVARDRDGSDYWDPGTPPAVRVLDENIYHFAGLRQDWQYRRSRRMMLKWGVDLRWGRSSYDYSNATRYWMPNRTDPSKPDWSLHFDTLGVKETRSGYEAGAYLANRVRLTNRLTLEAGLRYDRQSHTGGQQLSPRINAAFQLTNDATLRAAWGHYHQSHGLEELWTADTDTTFYPAQRAEHRVLGLEQRFGNGASLRVEAYERRLTNPLPEYRNLQNQMEPVWEEGPDDRIFVYPERGRARGLEILLTNEGTGRFAWAGSYVLSKVEEVISGEWVPRPFDQRHTVALHASFHPTPTWSLGVGWIYHSPWPYTEISYSVDETVGGLKYPVPHIGKLNQGRLTPYRRLDVRASKLFRLSRGDLLLYLDVFNVLNRENALARESGAWVYDGRLYTDWSIYPQLELMPSIGARWVF